MERFQSSRAVPYVYVDRYGINGQIVLAVDPARRDDMTCRLTESAPLFAFVGDPDSVRRDRFSRPLLAAGEGWEYFSADL
jgi:hypothetical protein